MSIDKKSINLVNTWSFLGVVLYIGFASGQKVIQLTYCSVNVDDLRMDCKYSLTTESPEAFCKYTQGARLLDTTDPDEEQHAPFKNRAKVRIFPGNNCRLLFKNLPNGKSNFTCNIKQTDSATAFKTSVVEKSKLLTLTGVVYHSCAHPVVLFYVHKDTRVTMLLLPNLNSFFLIAELLLPCSAWSVLLQSCSGLLLTLMTLLMLLEIHWQWTRRQIAAYINNAPTITWRLLWDSPHAVHSTCIKY